MIEINNLTNFTVDEKSFSQVAKIVLKGENRESKTISLAFVSKEEIKKLNKKFRNENKPTDVLSFLLNDRDYLGEVIICPEIVMGKKSLPAGRQEKIKEVFIHGILHLLGYDHEGSKEEAEEMEIKQNLYLSKIK